MLQRLAQLRVALPSSLNKRTFSMAMTAWSANVSRSAICFSVERPDFRAANSDRSDGNTFAQQVALAMRSDPHPLAVCLNSGNSVCP